MARYWSPHYKCRCRVCGWKGKRTLRTMSTRCPRCQGYNTVKKTMLVASLKID